MTASSNANTSGLEVVGWIKRTNENHPIGLTQPGNWRLSPHKPVLGEGSRDEWFDVHEVVTAASAQTRIDAAEARADRLASAMTDLVSWFDKPVQGECGMVWVIRAGDQGADDAVTESRAALQQEG